MAELSAVKHGCRRCPHQTASPHRRSTASSPIKANPKIESSRFIRRRRQLQSTEITKRSCSAPRPQGISAPMKVRPRRATAEGTRSTVFVIATTLALPKSLSSITMARPSPRTRRHRTDRQACHRGLKGETLPKVSDPALLYTRPHGPPEIAPSLRLFLPGGPLGPPLLASPKTPIPRAPRPDHDLRFPPASLDAFGRLTRTRIFAAYVFSYR